MKKLMIAAVAAFAVMGGAAQAEMKKVVIGTEAAYAPFEYVDGSGNIVGYEIELGNEICAAADLQCEWVNVAWDSLIPQLLEGKIDAIISSMSITEKRKQTIDFSGSYYQTPASFAGPKGKEFPITKDGVKGKVVGVQTGTIHADYLDKHFKDLVEVRRYPSQEEANMDLVSGRVDAILADAVVTGEWLKTDDGKNMVFYGDMLNDPVFGEGVGVGLRKGSDELKAAFQKGIDAVKASGKAEELSMKWFGFDVTTK